MSIRTALIGRGMAGTIFHAPLIRSVPELELVTVAGADGAAAAIASEDIDLVVVATPNGSHFPLARAALEAGKHVVVDKPFTTSVADADALIALAAARQRMLTVFHNRRWDGDFLTVRQLIESGRLGEIGLFEAHWDRFRPEPKPGWRETGVEGSGLLWDLGPHLIDQALLLFGRPDSAIGDVATQRRGAAADDYFAITLRYGRRRIRLCASNLVAEPRPRFAVHGTSGSFVKHGLDPQEEALRLGIAPQAGPPGILTGPDGGREEIPTVPGRYSAFYEGVAAAVGGRAPPPVDPADAREGMRIIEQARAGG
ncbi:MAG TPA: Gfo/Idh/MocA family oxidoreductase [Allosphingosinicella sp.]|nr:Gfo/Idh/MocA family oxidoreductase [Allosphingosinicella sp.]